MKSVKTRAEGCKRWLTTLAVISLSVLGTSAMAAGGKAEEFKLYRQPKEANKKADELLLKTLTDSERTWVTKWATGKIGAGLVTDNAKHNTNVQMAEDFLKEFKEEPVKFSQALRQAAIDLKGSVTSPLGFLKDVFDNTTKTNAKGDEIWGNTLKGKNRTSGFEELIKASVGQKTDELKNENEDSLDRLFTGEVRRLLELTSDAPQQVAEEKDKKDSPADEKLKKEIAELLEKQKRHEEQMNKLREQLANAGKTDGKVGERDLKAWCDAMKTMLEGLLANFSKSADENAKALTDLLGKLNKKEPEKISDQLRDLLASTKGAIPEQQRRESGNNQNQPTPPQKTDEPSEANNPVPPPQAPQAPNFGNPIGLGKIDVAAQKLDTGEIGKNSAESGKALLKRAKSGAENLETVKAQLKRAEKGKKVDKWTLLAVEAKDKKLKAEISGAIDKVDEDIENFTAALEAFGKNGAQLAAGSKAKETELKGTLTQLQQELKDRQDGFLTCASAKGAEACTAEVKVKRDEVVQVNNAIKGFDAQKEAVLESQNNLAASEKARLRSLLKLKDSLVSAAEEAGSRASMATNVLEQVEDAESASKSSGVKNVAQMLQNGGGRGKTSGSSRSGAGIYGGGKGKARKELR